MRPLKSILLIAALAALLLADTAAARIIMLDANFDARAVGSQLDRRGALFGEPVPGPYDYGNEVVYQDNPGDNSIQLPDTQLNGLDELYWTLRDGLAVRDGKLFISCELELEYPGEYRVVLRNEDPVGPTFFVLLFDAAGNVSWRDADDLTPTTIGFYPIGVPCDLEWEFDMDGGIYNFSFNGAPVVVGGTHGVVDEGLGTLVVGHRDDGDTAGSLRFDAPSWTWRPGAISEILHADFSSHPAGQPIGTGGAEQGEPIAIGGCVPTVEVGMPLGNKALLIPDGSDVGVASTRWEFLGGAEPTTPLSVSFWMTLDTPDGYVIYVREQGSSTRIFLNITINSAGQVFLKDANGQTWVVHSCAFGVPIHVEMAFEPDRDEFSVWWDNARILHRANHGITDREVGRLVFGCDFDADFDGAMRIDKLQVHTLDLTTPVDDATPAPSQLAVQAAPNPFNPATTVYFDLPRAARTHVDIVDTRGRLVRRLLDRTLDAGRQQATWRGEDADGNPVASGIYLAVVTAGDLRQATRVALVK